MVFLLQVSKTKLCNILCTRSKESIDQFFLQPGGCAGLVLVRQRLHLLLRGWLGSSREPGNQGTRKPGNGQAEELGILVVGLYLFRRINKIGLKNAGLRVQVYTRLLHQTGPDYLLFILASRQSPNCWLCYEKLKLFAFHIILSPTPLHHLPIIW